MNWPPPKRKVKNDFIISIDHDPDYNELQVPDQTRTKNVSVFVVSSTDTDAIEQLD